MTPEVEFLTVVKDALKAQTYNKCDRWAVAYRTMQNGKQYSLDRYPYIREILRSRARKNWVRKAAQVGLTEAGITIALFEIDRHRRDVIYYFPTAKMASKFSKTRFASAIDHSDHLRSVITNDSVEMKQIGTSTLHVMGASSYTDLHGTSSGRLILDELDKWTDRQIFLAEERMSGQEESDGIVWGFSTPTIPAFGIDKQYAASTQEHFFFDCPHCREEISLHWGDSFELFGERPDDPDTLKSYIKCSKCQEKLDHRKRPEWLAGGRWRATNPDADPELSRGFWLSQLYSPTISPTDLAVAYLRGQGDEQAMREFFNSKLGLPYLGDAYRIDDAMLAACVKKYHTADVRPKTMSEGLITLGIDVGGAMHHWVAVKWRFDPTRPGDPNDKAQGQVIGFGRIMQDDWAGIHGLMAAYQVRKCVIDSEPGTTKQREFARAFPGHVYLCYYVTGRSGREVTIHEDVYGANNVKCDKTGWLSKSIGRVMARDLELPLDMSLEFQTQLKNSVRTIQMVDQQPVAKFIDTGPDHYLHALTYAEIALKVMDPSLATSDVIT
jgi:hypothetical protein